MVTYSPLIDQQHSNPRTSFSYQVVHDILTLPPLQLNINHFISFDKQSIN
jgi:hypothetical protein